MFFEPISYDHAAFLIGEKPWNVSRSSELLALAHINAMETYGYNKCVVGLDIYNIEPEAYGSKILEPTDSRVPTIEELIFTQVDEIFALNLDPYKSGRIPMVFDAADQIAKKNPKAEIRIPLSGPFTIACNLLGMENVICETLINPIQIENILMHLARNQVIYGMAAIRKGYEITIFESSVTPPLLSPQLFKDHVLPAIKYFLDKLKEITKNGIQFIIGGDTSPILDSICSLLPKSIICPAETDQQKFMAYIQEKGFDKKIDVRINMKPSVFLTGNQEWAINEASRVLSVAKGIKGVTFGSIMPYEADPAIVKNVSNFISSFKVH